MKSINLSI